MKGFKIGAPSVRVFADSKLTIEPQKAEIIAEFNSKKGNRMLVVEFSDKVQTIVPPEALAYAHKNTPFLGAETKKGNKTVFELAESVEEGEFIINPDANIGVREGVFYAE